jgi:phi13 family phage major tail protein
MSTIGLRDLFAAKITEDPATGDETYAAPVRIAKAIKAELNVETATATLYADDSVDVIINEFVSGTLRLTANDLTLANQALLLGQQVDSNDVAFGNRDDAPPYFGIGFCAKRPDGTFRYVWLYKVKFKAPAETFDTKGNSITFNTPLLEGELISRNKDGEWKADYIGQPTDTMALAWFTAVYEKTP